MELPKRKKCMYQKGDFITGGDRNQSLRLEAQTRSSTRCLLGAGGVLCLHLGSHYKEVHVYDNH